MGIREPAIAEAMFKEHLSQVPRDGRAAVGIAWSDLSLGDYHSAVAMARRAIASGNLSPLEKQAAQILLARALFRLGKNAQAWRYFYGVWQKGNNTVRSCIDSEIKSLALTLPRSTPGVPEVLEFTPPPRPKPTPVVRARPKPTPLAQKPVIIPRKNWHPMNPNKLKLAPMGRPFRITIHHSADIESSGPTSWGQAAQHIRAIQHDHMFNRGWADIGYHFFIDRSGRIWEGRSLKYQGAHAGNYEANRGNIGVVVEGNFQHEEPTRAQIRSLKSLIQYLCKKYRIPKWRVYPHSHFRSTACPGRYLERLITELR